MKQVICLFTFLLLLSTQTRASHLAGGELRYEFNGTNYELIFTMYRDCTGIPLPGSVTVAVSSVSQNSSFNITLQQTSNTIASMPCPSGTNKCYNTSSLIPGFAIGTYRAQITLPAAANDWVFSTSQSARNNTTNLIGTANMYASATLNNTNGNNTCALIPNTAPIYITTNTVVVPLQYVDADGDSVVIAPTSAKSAAGSNVTYNTGYSATMPFGTNGIYTINTMAQNMTLKGGNLGQFALAFLVKEYRNGSVIAEYTRDFNCSVLSGTISYSYPVISSQSNTTAYACPGAQGSATVSFTDPVSTDSVYIDVDTPGLSGWNFSISNTPGVPTASATISWTAPANLNPAMLPHFYIKLKVRDNACPRGVANYVVLVKTQQCPTDSVWPGDANSDKIANLLDVLAVAVAYNQTGPARPNANNSWTAQWAQNWGSNYPIIGVNMKHGDCNGNGVVNLADLIPIASNYGLTHLKGSPHSKTTGVPDLYFDMTGIQLAPGKTVSIPIKVGSSTSPIVDFYGLAAYVKITGLTLTKQAVINTTGSWLGNSSSTINFVKNLNMMNVDWAFARNDQQNTNGTGTLAMLEFEIPANTPVGQNVNLDFGNAVMIDKDGKYLTDYNVLDANAVTVPAGISNKNVALQSATIIPNPSGNNARLHMQLTQNMKMQVRIADVTGKIVHNHTEALAGGSNYITLPATNLAGGVYTIHIADTDGTETQVLKWIKQ